MKLTLENVVGKYESSATPEILNNIIRLTDECNRLIRVMEADGVVFKTNPITGSIISGETLGGLRPQSCPIGAPKSAHKLGMAVDIYDPDNKIDSWLASHPSVIKEYDLWFEHPTATNHWSHWSTRKPGSGRKFFLP